MSARVGSQFRPQLESLDGRIVPATNSFLGGDSFASTSWSLGHYPTYFEDVVFDGALTTDSCTLVAIGPYSSVRLVNGYTGTVMHTTSLWLNTLVLEGGALNPSASDKSVSVSQNFTWTGGTLNGTANLATVTLNGATGLIAPAGGGTVNLGSNLSFAGGAGVTVKEGTIDANKDGLSINTYTGSSLHFSPGTLAPIVVGASSYVNGFIGTGTIWTVTNGNVAHFDGKLVNGGGDLVLDADSQMRILGKPMDDYAYVQTAGNTYLKSESWLRTAADTSIRIVSGTVATIYSAGSKGSNADALVTTDTFEFVGGSIYLDYQGTNYHFGELRVAGNVHWIGGVFHVSVYVGGACDVWRADEEFDIDGGLIDPLYVDSDYGNSSLPVSGSTWQILKAGQGFVDNDAPSVNDTELWVTSLDPGNPATFWALTAR